MNLKKNIRTYLKIYFFILLFGLALHLFWNFTLASFPEMVGISAIQFNFLRQLNLDIALIFLFMTILTFKIIFSDLFNREQTRYLIFLMIIFWILRFINEIILPIRVSLLYTSFSSLIFKFMLLIAIAILLFLNKSFASDPA